jgi:geranylgeranyl diphosphate synthase type I
MTTVLIMPTGAPTAARADPAGLTELSARVAGALRVHLDAAVQTLQGVGGELEPVAAATREFVLAGGKRLRPAFCYWGWRGAGAPDSEKLITAAAALELLHACALIHDDVMDGSRIRRGKPAVHRQFADLHRQRQWAGCSETFGDNAAILVGDLCLVWADAMFTGCGLDARAVQAAGTVYAEMRVELIAGQYLDVLASVVGDDSAAATERALRVARFKTAKYTVCGPLQLGAALAGGPGQLLATYAGYGLPLGEAFQLRDDILGLYGDPAVTGKPAGDDLREGKRTALVTLAEQRGSPDQVAELKALVGDPQLGADGVARCRDLIRDCGALDEVESLISRRTEQARNALEDAALPAPAREALDALALAATGRAG